MGVDSVVEGGGRSWWRRTWIGECVHGGGCEHRNRGADGALASEVDAAPVGEIDAVENVVIQKTAFRDVGVDGWGRNGGKVGIGKGSRFTRNRRLAFPLPTLVVGGAGCRGEIRRR